MGPERFPLQRSPDPTGEPPAVDFDSLGLGEPLLRAVADKGYRVPSPIQRDCIPAVLSGRDVMAAAQTGTGKTAGFTLPMLERLRHGPHARAGVVRSLVLTPTRELAAQVAESVTAYGRYLDLRSDVVFGGVKVNPQISRLQRGTDVLVATPGRLMDLHQQKALRLDRVEILVLDEADRMLDMGFIRDIQKILALLPAKRQNLLFSATFNPSIRRLATGLLHNPLQLQASPENRTATTVEHILHPCDMGRKPDLLCHLIASNDWRQVLVFSRTKHGANRLAERLTQEGMAAAAIHGNKSQGARTRALAGFKSGELRVLVATDLAARGIDIHQLPHVVNLDLPNQAEDYVHRIGRTGRAGHNGHAVSLVAAEEHELLRAIEKMIGTALPRLEVPGFEPKVLSAAPLDLSGGRGRGGPPRSGSRRPSSSAPSGRRGVGGGGRSEAGRPESGRRPQRRG
ncbi:DEAD/DEAH box helicase [Synechococcus sp. CS-1328]|uniref:DEAD/DEAH box helicase n=1 Tax=Synechococcus sp. CS-1328 TaxID=2847976 RepID=UPI00223B49AE|nr:DEAD/DEAH box helicase [Synechococcus sp. CS-1328]MCT0226458.1 DEAD/DEAH box helicase [Synechococcus sp. CS-1328]